MNTYGVCNPCCAHQMVITILLYSTRSTLKPMVGIVVTTSFRWSLYCRHFCCRYATRKTHFEKDSGGGMSHQDARV